MEEGEINQNPYSLVESDSETNCELDCESECVICLESIDKTIDTFMKCNVCENIFHKKCIYNLKKKECPLCRTKINVNYSNKYNAIFNNMNDDEVYNIDKYIDKWGRKTCLDNNHKFRLETLGDWGLRNGRLTFKYTCMHIQCIDCDISTIMK